ncbi:hypothetical protein DFI_18650 (plasmid) [Deinococcus ficus]|uniref:Peptidase M15A C-terminal domain-containing protein n=2 Tax=Deinococcus ficus TaxID=317577 RepID=A0A221T2T6_9DEIO|nr:hypothetical protein DFI_18650 [Deinococcus ficus]
MLYGLLRIADKYRLRVTDLAGGSHEPNSRHYLGVAFDADTINGVRVSKNNPSYAEVMRLCRLYGATEILGPGKAGHSYHIHCAWPKP